MFVQLTFKYRQIVILLTAHCCHYTVLCTSSNRALLLACPLAAKVHLFQVGEVLHSIRVTVLCLGFPQKSEYSRNFKFIDTQLNAIMWVTGTLTGFMSE